MILLVAGGWDMASGYEKIDCGVIDPNLGWGVAKPAPVSDALLMAVAIAGGLLHDWSMIQGLRFLFGF